MGRDTETLQLGHAPAPSGDGHRAFELKDRILRVRSRSPFHDLGAAWPADLAKVVQDLVRQGAWGQILVCQNTAGIASGATEDLRARIAQRYADPETRPVTALVFETGIEGRVSLAPRLLTCFQEAGVECRLFEDVPTALDWVDSRIRPLAAHVEWRPEYRLGESDIDEQHRELFGRAAYVVGATSHQGQVMAAMRLFQYMRSHVSYEDELMRRHGYPAIDEHRAQHRDLMEKMIEISHSIANEDRVLVDLEKFIARLFLAHMHTADRKLAEYLQLQGNAAPSAGPT